MEELEYKRAVGLSFWTYLHIYDARCIILAMAPLKESDRREFAKLIKRLESIRHRLGWSQGRMSELCGVTQETYSRWCSGKSQPNSLAFAGLRARVPELIAELRATWEAVERVFNQIQDEREGR